MIKPSKQNTLEKPTTVGFFNSRLWTTLGLCFLLIMPIVFLSLPKDYFTGKQSICVSILIFDQRCYACGMTKAIKSITNFDFKSAQEFNVLSFVVFPILVFYWGTLVVKNAKKLM